MGYVGSSTRHLGSPTPCSTWFSDGPESASPTRIRLFLTMTRHRETPPAAHLERPHRRAKHGSLLRGGARLGFGSGTQRGEGSVCACARPIRRTSSESSPPVMPRPWRARGRAAKDRRGHQRVALRLITSLLRFEGLPAWHAARTSTRVMTGISTLSFTRACRSLVDQIPLLIARGGDARDARLKTALFGVVGIFRRRRVADDCVGRGSLVVAARGSTGRRERVGLAQLPGHAAHFFAPVR